MRIHDEPDASLRSTSEGKSPWWKTAWSVVRDAYVDFQEDDAERHAAALSYYAVLSFGPILFVVVAIAGWVVGDESAREGVLAQVESYLGHDGRASAEDLMRAAHRPTSGGLAALVGVGVLLYGASKVFAELERTLDAIWEVPPNKDAGIRDAIVRRGVSLALLVGVAMLLLTQLVLSTALSALAGRAEGILPGGSFFWGIAHFGVSLGMLTVLFAMLFKSVPAAPITWRDVWPGAGATALMFVLGQMLLGLYLGRVGWTSAYGAAASIIVLFVWVYYAAQIFLFGAELTQVFARRFGSRAGTDLRSRDQAALGDGKDGDEHDDEGVTDRITLPGESPETRRARTGLRWNESTP